MPKLIQQLPEGPLDIVGDVHGELEALLALLHRLGADPERKHAERPIVFVGDLVDRGPDSVGVVEVFERLQGAGLAYAVVGNHELNLLANDKKEGNGWFFDKPDTAQIDGRSVPFPSRVAGDSDRTAIRRILSELPLVLERPDLRVVHAYWEPTVAAKLPENGDLAVLLAEFDERIEADLIARGVQQQAEAERAEFAGLKNQAVRPNRHLPAVVVEDLAKQIRNPIKLLTSGPETEVPSGEHFFVGGKWRFVQRDRWWLRPVDRPSVVGHYWRRRSAPVEGKADVWDNVSAYAWSGNVFCADYSVGRRYAERFRGRTSPFDGGLAALRWPERELVFDDHSTPISTV